MTRAPAAARLVLLAGFVVLLFNSGGRFVMGLLFKPMVDDLGWDRATLSLSITLFMVISAVMLPVVGRLVDRFGPRGVLAGSTVICAGSIGAMSTVDTPAGAHLLYGVLFALGSAGTSITPIGVMLSRWFPQRLGMANSVAISGMGLGQLVIITLLASTLADIGWRGSFTALGIATLVCVTPLVLLAGRGAAPPAPVDPTPAPGTGAPGSLGEVARRGHFWWLLVLYAICGAQDFYVATHVVAFALDAGAEPLLAGNMLALMGLLGLGGVLATGYLNDRFGPMLPTAACFVIRIAGFGAVLLWPSVEVIGVTALAYGVTFWITAPLTVVFARRAFGLALLGTVSGIITMVHHGAGGLGAYLGAAIFDRTGSYQGATLTMLALSVAGLALCGLGAGRRWDRNVTET